MSNLREKIIKLAYQTPTIREHLLHLLSVTAKMTSPTPEGARDLFNQYKEEHPATKKQPQEFYEPSKEKAPKSESTTTKRIVPKVETKNPVSLFGDLSVLPDQASHSEKDPDKIFQQAKQTHEMQLDLLNRGKGLDAVLGASVLRADKADTPDWNKKGPLVVIGPLKGQGRSKEKVEQWFGGDWSRLTDIVRASVAVDNYAELPKVITALKKAGIKLARKPTDRFLKPTVAGYRDLSLNVTYPNGHVGELQLHVKPMLKAKEHAHKLYEKVRSIEANAKKELRESLTDEEQRTVDEANAQMTRFYDEAWAEAHKAIPKTKRETAKVSTGIKYFEYNGHLALQEPKKFPHALVNGKKVIVWDLETFYREAQPLTPQEASKYKEFPKK